MYVRSNAVSPQFPYSLSIHNHSKCKIIMRSSHNPSCKNLFLGGSLRGHGKVQMIFCARTSIYTRRGSTSNYPKLISTFPHNTHSFSTERTKALPEHHSQKTARTQEARKLHTRKFGNTTSPSVHPQAYEPRSHDLRNDQDSPSKPTIYFA